MNFVRSLASRCLAILRVRTSRETFDQVPMDEIIRHGKRAGYVECLRSIGESPLDKIAIGESGQLVYRFTLLGGCLFDWIPRESNKPEQRLPSLWIQITEVSHCLTVVLKAGEVEETINIDSSDCLFHERFRSLQENINTLDFWSMMPDLSISRLMARCVVPVADPDPRPRPRPRPDPDTCVIEVAHHDRYNWSSCWPLKMEGDFHKLCELFLNLPVYEGSILEDQVNEVKASWPRVKVQSAQEIEEEIEVELQALKSKLNLESQDDI
jgi:hypothetical protein